MSSRKSAHTDIYGTANYRAFLRSWIKENPDGARGQLTRMAEAAQIHKTTLSQILSGTKDLTLEQAFRLRSHLGLSQTEAEFFLLQVQTERAGSQELKEMFHRQMEVIKNKRKSVKERVVRSRELSSEERAIYYSNWMYSAVRNLTAIPEFRRPAALARRLSLEPNLVQKLLEFLLSTGLCVEEKGELRPGPQMTHLDAESPLVSRHHGNWRIKAMERHPALRPDTEISYTAPMTLSAVDVAQVQNLVLDLIQKTNEIVGPSASEKLYCLGIDWFEIK